MIWLHLGVVFVSALSLTLGHCGFMCGGVVVAYSHMIPNTKKHALIAHSLYNLGRLLSYVFIGILFVILGRGVSFFTFFRESMHFIVGVLLIFYAFCVVFFPKILRLFEIDITQSRIFIRLFGSFLHSTLCVKYFFIGILNGFLPCGLVYFFALSTLNAPSLVLDSGMSPIIVAFLIMSVFWLASLVPMVSIGALSSFLKRYQKTFLWASFGLMVVFGLLNIYQGLRI